MKYFLALFICFLALTGCDDGDLITDTFNFENTTVQKCATSNVLYKINGQEALIVTTPETNFPNEETTAGTPRVITIGGSTSVVYRKYSSDTNTSNICGTPTISVQEEWVASGGTVEITSTKIFDTTDPTKVIAYNHTVAFKNITFVAPDKQVVYDNYVFGNHRTNVVDLNFSYDSVATQECDNNNLIFKYNISNALLLDIDPTLFANEVTPAGSPRTRLIDNTTNKVTYRVYSGSLNYNYFCSAITPATPSLTEEWVADNGVVDVSGVIKVVTEATIDPNIFKHTIYLYKTTFRKGIQYYSPNPDGDYVFGEYYTNL